MSLANKLGKPKIRPFVPGATISQQKTEVSLVTPQLVEGIALSNEIQEIVEGEFAIAVNLAIETQDGDTDIQEVAASVFEELAAHIEEGHEGDGRFNYFYYGATSSPSELAKRLSLIAELLAQHYDDDSFQIAFHRSCAYPNGSEIVVVSVSLYYPDPEKIARGVYRMSLGLQGVNYGKSLQRIELLIDFFFQIKNLPKLTVTNLEEA